MTAKSENARRHQQETARRWAEARVAEGGRRFSVLLLAEDAARLERLTSRYGSARATVLAALRYLETLHLFSEDYE